jgi:phage replication O-like protein O
MPKTNDPQLEDGYTRIANELYEAILGFGFSQRQLLVVLTIIRKTYGYGKKEDDMSAAQIGELCNIGRNHVTEVIGQLVQMNVLNRASGTFGLKLGINKSYKSWVKEQSTSPKSGLGKVVPNRDKSSPKSGRVDSPKLGHTKENLSKENQKKSARLELSLSEWLSACKESGEQPIPPEDTIFGYAKDVVLPVEFIRYAWLEFKRKYGSDNKKKYKDWRAHFRNAVRENWYGVWFERDGEWLLTTRGKQIKREVETNESQRHAA